MGKYFIMGWDDDSEQRKYHDFYFVADKNGNLLLFDTVKEAESFGHKSCKHFNICGWNNYMVGDEKVNINRLVLKNCIEDFNK
jgi:hypothetical protein